MAYDHYRTIFMRPYQLFELSDEPPYPKALLYGLPGEPQRLWERRWKLDGPLAVWLQSLDAKPQELVGGMPRGMWSAGDCRLMIAARVKRLIWVAGGWPRWLVVPQFSQRYLPPRSVTRCCPDGQRSYPSLRAASRSSGVHHWQVRRLCDNGRADSEGCYWKFGV